MRQGVTSPKISAESLTGLAGPGSPLWIHQLFAQHREVTTCLCRPTPLLWNYGLKQLLRKKSPIPACLSHCFYIPCLNSPRSRGFLRHREGRQLVQGHAASLELLRIDFLTSRICFFSNLEVAACLSRDVPGGMPGSETLYLSLFFIFFQGPPGNPGIPGLPGSEGPPVRTRFWEEEEGEGGGLGV